MEINPCGLENKWKLVLPVKYTIFPDDAMPFIMIRNTIPQEPTRQRKVQYFTPPKLSE